MHSGTALMTPFNTEGHEATDAKLFASWGIDFIKLDFGCENDVSLHDGTGSRPNIALLSKGAIEFHAFAPLETLPCCVFNSMHRGWPLPLTGG
jgi:hypothetical protein